MKKCYQTEKGKTYDKKYRKTLNGYLNTVYAGMRHRCNNPSVCNYHRYGGRGIENRFESLDDFRDYVINTLKVDPRGIQIDRIDNNGHYEPGNIRFVTAKVNCSNRKRKGD